MKLVSAGSFSKAAGHDTEEHSLAPFKRQEIGSDFLALMDNERVEKWARFIF